jgi:UDP-glucose 4-epimerase
VKALVTGGAGFIGSTLVDRLLAEGWEVEVVDDLSSGSLANLVDARAVRDRRFRFHKLDVTAAEATELVVRRRPDVVFHLAAQASVARSNADPVLDASVNVLGTLRILEGARLGGVGRVIYAASGGTLYGAEATLPAGEDQPWRPASPYGVSKKVAIEYLALYRSLHDVEFVALALANVYGPRQDPHGEAGVVAIFARALLEGRPCEIHGTGLQTRDFVYVDDVVDAFMRALERGGGLVVNVGSGTETSVVDLHRRLASLAGCPSAPVVPGPARPGDVARSVLDVKRAELHLGWRAWTPLDEGCRAVLEHLSASIRPPDTPQPTSSSA